ncbi:MAG: [Fe-Fe] hydrogenase large subunit C-terminal domain-containing protein [Christensenellales bacterium]|jgi:iron only hydrogenase large subunit-like protein|nr:4Fe-4S dicluster domain-containing protein [Clostridiales bacterium]
MADKKLHTVTLEQDKCKGCVACMKRCPTEAIRVREGKAKIHYDRCIGCGECVRICPHNAKKVVYDDFDIINNYKYKIALPAPSFYGQFNNIDNLGIIIEGLKNLGFDEVSEVAVGAELVTDATKKVLSKGAIKKPIISTACPAILQLILIRYHSLTENLLNMLAPVDVVAKLAKENAEKKTGLKPEEIGVFFISPCPAKVFALKSAFGVKEPLVQGVLAASDIYFRLLPHLKNIKFSAEEPKAGMAGISWACSGGEASGVMKDKYIYVDGIENCMNVLKQLEDKKLDHIDFVEMNACVSGCVGGVLNIENPFVARSKIRELEKYLPKYRNNVEFAGKDLDFFQWEVNPETNDVMRLDEDFMVALKKMSDIDAILKGLPGLDCGNCGAPSCRAFAEDVVNGEADLSLCNRKEDAENNG